MENEKFDVRKALSYLKAGYRLVCKEEHLSYAFGKIRIRGENASLTLNAYRFLDLYKDGVFSLDEEENGEDLVDPKKDEEYYSFRQ